MKTGLEGKIVLVTGGSKGLGLACTRAFSSEGARVAIASRSLENLAKAQEMLAAEGSEVATVQADFASPDEARSAVLSTERMLGPIDVLVNCAGATRRYTTDELDAEAWHQGMNSKYFPYINAIDAVRVRMIERRAGTIVNVIGMGGKFASPTHLSGGAANAALMNVTAGWALALGKYGIRVNAVNPGPTLTERIHQNMQIAARNQGITEAEALRRLEESIPLGRLARPEEVAAVVLFLASELSSYMTAAIVPVDGGRFGVI